MMEIRCGDMTLHPSQRTHVMGILNVTPDSFFDGGKFLGPEQATEHALRLEREGADILDIGGESTRPGAETVEAGEESDRILPVLNSLQSRLRIPISVDTRKASVAEEALRAGARLLNDVSGLRHDPKMAEVASRFGIPVVLMHMRGTPMNMQSRTEYRDLVGEVVEFFEERIRFAESNGIRRENIILDPGIGFGKRWEDNFILLRNLDRIRNLGFPVLVGVSRKSFIGRTLNLPESERLTGTLAAVTAAVIYGAHLVRVHDVREAVQAVRIADYTTNPPSPIRDRAA